MALDSRQKRMSAMNLGSPWRGPLVDATEAGFGQGNRAAACWLYSGIAATIVVEVPPGVVTMEYSLDHSRMHYSLNRSQIHYELQET